MPMADNGPTLLTVLCWRITSAISGTCWVRCTYTNFDATVIFLARHRRLRRFSFAGLVHSLNLPYSIQNFRTAQIRCISWPFRRLDRHIPRSPSPTSEVSSQPAFSIRRIPRWPPPSPEVLSAADCRHTPLMLQCVVSRTLHNYFSIPRGLLRKYTWAHSRLSLINTRPTIN
jgi:hypothetical protein